MGRRPERTTYRLTQHGADELRSWLRQFLEEPTREYPQFGAALMFLGAMGFKEEAIKVLERRWVFLPGLIISGFGLGFVWTPVFQHRHAQPQP